MLYALFAARVVEQRGPIASQVMALIEGMQRQRADVDSDLPTVKIALHGLAEGEAELCYTTSCHPGMLPNGVLRLAKTQRSRTF